MIQESSASRPKIAKLPDYVINQIKAGEIVERPAFILKELIENSIDANATSIDVCVKNGGVDLISIEDNGIGMSEEDLPLAFGRHATSKLSSFEQLYDLHSFGFRGEALASVASVSKVICTSVPRHSTTGGKIEIEGGSTTNLGPYHGQSGTKIIITNLFYNTPVRLKFLRSQQSEKNQLKKIFHSFVLANPDIRFSVKWDDRPKEHFPPQPPHSPFQRIKKVLNRKNSSEDGLIIFDKSYEQYSVKGILLLQTLKTAAAKNQYVFVNKRYITDRSFHHIVVNALKDLWPRGESGPYVLLIQGPSSEIDVNVHPNKTSIKFSGPEIINSLILHAIREATKHLVRDTHTVEVEHQTIPNSADQNEPWTNNQPQSFHSEPDPSLQISGISKLNHRYILFQENNLFYIVSLEKTLMVFFKKTIGSKKIPVEDRLIQPLLVAIPLKISLSDDLILSFHQFGICIETYNSKQYLKGIPQFFEKIDPLALTILIELLAKYLSKVKNTFQREGPDLSKVMKSSEAIYSKFDANFWNHAIKTVKMSGLLDDQAAYLLSNDDVLHRVFS